MTAEPHRQTLDELRREAARCTGCPLYQRATQTVFGEGPEGAPGMLVGEQPGDREEATVHPSSVVRVEDAAQRAAGLHRFVEDLGAAARQLAA